MTHKPDFHQSLAGLCSSVEAPGKGRATHRGNSDREGTDPVVKGDVVNCDLHGKQLQLATTARLYVVEHPSVKGWVLKAIGSAANTHPPPHHTSPLPLALQSNHPLSLAARPHPNMHRQGIPTGTHALTSPTRPTRKNMYLPESLAS